MNTLFSHPTRWNFAAYGMEHRVTSSPHRSVSGGGYPNFSGAGITPEPGSGAIELLVLYVFVATIVPRKPMLLVRPEALEEWKFIALVKPQGVSDEISISSTVEGPECASKGVLQYIGVISVCLVSRTSLNLLSYCVHSLCTHVEGQPTDNHFGMVE